MTNLYIVYIFIFFTLLVNIFSFLKNRKIFENSEKLLFLYLFCSIILWALSNALADIIKIEEYAIFFSRLSILFPLNILNALAQITRNYPRIIGSKSFKNLFKFLNIFTIVFTIIAIVLLNSDLNIVSYHVYQDAPVDYTPGHLYFALAFLSVIILSTILYVWIKNLFLYTKTQKVQIYYLFGSLFLVFVSMIIGFVVLPSYGLSVYAPIMFLSLSFMLFIINKSLLVRVAVVDIQEEFVKLFGSVLSAIILLSFWNVTAFTSNDINIVGKFLISFLFLMILNYIYKIITDLYDKKQKNTEDEIRKFIDMSRTFLLVNDVLDHVRITLTKILIIEDVKYVSLKEHKESHFISNFLTWWGSRSKTPFVNREVLIESYYDRENNKEITKEIYSYLHGNNVDMIIPISTDNKLRGLLYIFGVKKLINEYLYKDLSLLSDSISISMSRASAYQELEQFNQTLQQKVDDQTKELQIKVQQLQEARRKERDMIDIMGHELRTPATIVKLNTELLEQFTDDVVNNKDKFTLYVKRIKTAVENEIKLINTLLSSAKLEGDKIELNPEEIKILEDIDMSVHGHEAMALEKGLELVNNSDPNTPNIYADHARVLEILNNLLDNAIKYTDTGSVSVSTSYTDSMVTVNIHDTGKGIPEEELPNLGQKFYRVGNYLDNGEGKPDLVRPGGTGLGLYVAFSLVDKMGGKMEVTSEMGKGSTFSFTLPRINGQIKSNSNKQESKDMFERLGLKR